MFGTKTVSQYVPPRVIPVSNRMPPRAHVSQYVPPRVVPVSNRVPPRAPVSQYVPPRVIPVSNRVPPRASVSQYVPPRVIPVSKRVPPVSVPPVPVPQPKPVPRAIPVSGHVPPRAPVSQYVPPRVIPVSNRVPHVSVPPVPVPQPKPVPRVIAVSDRVPPVPVPQPKPVPRVIPVSDRVPPVPVPQPKPVPRVIPVSDRVPPVPVPQPKPVPRVIPVSDRVPPVPVPQPKPPPLVPLVPPSAARTYKVKREYTQLERDVKWVRAQGVKSNTALVDILAASRSNTYEITLEDCTNRFLEETRIIQTIHDKSMSLFSSPVEQDTYFAYHTLFYLQFGTTAEEARGEMIGEPTCPYGDDAYNFMITLMKSGKCLCACYTGYVLAMSEQFGHDNVERCTPKRHTNIAVTDPREQSTIDTSSYNSYWVIPEESYIYPTRSIYALIDAGFENNFYTWIDTVDPNFERKYTVGIHHVNYYITLHDQVTCEKGGYFIHSPWKNISVQASRLARRKSHPYKDAVLLLNAVYGNYFSGLSDLHDYYVELPLLREADFWYDNDKAEETALMLNILRDFKKLSRKIKSKSVDPISFNRLMLSAWVDPKKIQIT